MGINHITLMGNVVRGPEFRMTPNGVPTATLSLAVVRPPRQDGGPEITDYVRCVIWRALAEKVNETVSKGDLVVVEGRLTTRSYETQDGQRRKTIEVEASAVDPVRGGGAAKGAGTGARESSPADDYGPPDDDFSDFEAPAPAPAPRPRPTATKPAAPPPDLDDEIPF